MSLSAQETEKKQYLPEQGDWAIGFDAKPVLNFVGNLFNGSPNNMSPTLGGESTLSTLWGPILPSNPTVSLMGKYMLTDNLALKANFGILIRNDKYSEYVQDDAAAVLDPLSNAQVADCRNGRNTGLSLMAGAEYRVGKKRVQGVFGGGLLFGLEKQLVKYSYGNEMTSINQRPTTPFCDYDATGGYRTLKEFTDKPQIYAGIVGTAGVEVFVAPKIALGAEVSLYAMYVIGQQTYTVSEGYNPATEVIEKKTDLVAPLTGSFRMGTDNLGGSLYLSFYF